jgi:hypothetical protein
MYQKPKVERFGSVRELTQDVLRAGSGDAMLFCAAGDGGTGGDPDDRYTM